MNDHDQPERPEQPPQHSSSAEDMPKHFWCVRCNAYRSAYEVIEAQTTTGADLYLCETCGADCEPLPL